jgi:hypothetical protein
MRRTGSRAVFALIVVSAVGFGVAGRANAADISAPVKAAKPEPALEAWTFKLTPYVWATGLDGSTTVKGRTTDVSASFVDIVEHTQFPKGLFEVAAFGEARIGPVSLLSDIAYLKLGLDSSITRSRNVDNLGLSVGASAGLKVEMVIAELAAAYEVGRWNSLFAPGTESALDLYGGARIWWQHADAELQLSGTLNAAGLTLTGSRTLSAARSVSWVDPVIGMRFRHQINRNLALIASGDIGGFGAGSEFSWQVIGALNYEFLQRNNVTWSGMVGYKALSVDYSQGSGLTRYEFDMVMHGPIVGLTARF